MKITKVKPETFEEYKKRVEGDFWYKMPLNRCWVFDDTSKYDEFWRNRWPRQYKLRTKIEAIYNKTTNWFNNLKDNVYFFFNPQNTWLTSKIRKSWMDKDEIFEVVITQGLKHFVENEDGMVQNDDSKLSNLSEIYDEIMDLYRWVTREYDKEVDKLSDEIKEARSFEYKTVDKSENGEYRKRLHEALGAMEDLKNVHTKKLARIVELRGYLWS